MTDSKNMTVAQGGITNSGQELSNESTFGSSERVTLNTKINGVKINGSDVLIKTGSKFDTTVIGGVNKIIYAKSVRSNQGGTFDGGDYVLGYNFESNKTVNAGDYGSIGSYIYNEGSRVSLNMSNYDDAVVNDDNLNNIFIDTKDGNDVVFNGIGVGYGIKERM